MKHKLLYILSRKSNERLGKSSMHHSNNMCGIHFGVYGFPTDQIILSRTKNCLLPTMVNLDIKGIPVNLSCPIYLQTIRKNNQSSPTTNGVYFYDFANKNKKLTCTNK